jgi:hypothetical protein
MILDLLRLLELEAENLLLVTLIAWTRYWTITVTALKWFCGVFFGLGLIAPLAVGLWGHPTIANAIANLAIIICGFLWAVVSVRLTLIAAGIDVAEGITPEVMRENITFFQNNNVDAQSIGAKTFRHFFLSGLWVLATLLIPGTFPIWNYPEAYLASISCIVLLTFYVAYQWDLEAKATRALRIIVAIMLAYNLVRMILPAYAGFLLVGALGMTYFAFRDDIKRDDTRRYADIVMAAIGVVALMIMLLPGTFSRITGWNNGQQAYETQQAEFEAKLRTMREKGIAEVNIEIQQLEQERINNHGRLDEAKQAQLNEYYRDRERIKNPPAAKIGQSASDESASRLSLLRLPKLSPEVSQALLNPSPYFAWGVAILAFVLAIALLNTSKSGIVKTFAGALWIGAVAYAYFVAYPVSSWSPTKRQLETIRSQYRTSTALQASEIRQQSDPVVAGFTDDTGLVHTDPAELKASLFDQARKAHQFAVDMGELEATAKGINIGDFTVDAQIPTFVDVGKKVCRGQWLEAWGEMDPRPGNDNYAHRIEAIGQDPLTNAYDGFQKLVERAPVGALIVSFGNRYQFDWQPMGGGHYRLTPDVDGCQQIKAVVNDWVRGTEPTFRNFHGENTGGFSVRIHYD